MVVGAILRLEIEVGPTIWGLFGAPGGAADRPLGLNARLNHFSHKKWFSFQRAAGAYLPPPRGPGAGQARARRGPGAGQPRRAPCVDGRQRQQAAGGLQACGLAAALRRPPDRAGRAPLCTVTGTRAAAPPNRARYGTGRMAVARRTCGHMSYTCMTIFPPHLIGAAGDGMHCRAQSRKPCKPTRRSAAAGGMPQAGRRGFLGTAPEHAPNRALHGAGWAEVIK